MDERPELPPDAGAWQVEFGPKAVRLTRGVADDLGALPHSGFSCPEEALPALVVALGFIERTAACGPDSGQPNGPCGIMLNAGRARIFLPTITHGVNGEQKWQKASSVEIRYADVPTALRRVTSLLDGTYGEPAKDWL